MHSLGPQTFLPGRSAYNTAESSDQVRDQIQKCKSCGLVATTASQKTKSQSLAIFPHPPSSTPPSVLPELAVGTEETIAVTFGLMSRLYTALRSEEINLKWQRHAAANHSDKVGDTEVR